MNRIKKWLTKDDGNATAAVLFALAASVLVAGLVASGVNAIQLTSASRVLNGVGFAVDARFELWASSMGAGGSASTASICYQAQNTCTSIIGVVENDEISYVTLQAINGDRTVTRTRAWADAGANTTTENVPALDAASTFSVLAATTVTNSGASNSKGDLGVHPAVTISGFPPGTIEGYKYAGGAEPAAAQADFTRFSNELGALAPTREIGGDINGLTLYPGVTHSGAALSMSGTLTLDAAGDPHGVFVIQVGGAVTTAAASQINLVGGAKASNVHWIVDGAVGVGAAANFVGNILAQGAVTLGAGAVLHGRAFSKGTVTLSDNDIRFS
jgi:hypothetical protein